jgi:anti-sigma factor RsiW
MLEPDEAARIKALALSNPDVAAKIKMFRQTASLTHATLAPLVDVPIPEALRTAVRNRIADHKIESVRRLPLGTMLQRLLPRWRFGLSMAAVASIAVLTGVVIGYQQGRLASDRSHIAVDAALSAPIATALNSARSGENVAVGADKLRLVSTFRVIDLSLCREFEYASQADGATVAVACRSNDIWKVRFAVTSNTSEDGYAPASSLEAVETYMTAIGARPALTSADEDAALKSN